MTTVTVMDDEGDTEVKRSEMPPFINNLGEFLR